MMSITSTLSQELLNEMKKDGALIHLSSTEQVKVLERDFEMSCFFVQYKYLRMYLYETAISTTSKFMHMTI